MRLAVLSDIHGNTPALEAVLADAALHDVDAVVVTGDVVAGPDPVGVLERLSACGRPVYWVKGNADQEVVDAFDGVYAPVGGVWDAITRGAASRLGRAGRDRVAGWPDRLVLPVDGLGEVLFVHATPRSLTETLTVDAAPERWQAALEGIEAGTVVLGHTHMPFVRLLDRRWLVNPGSVGMPYGSVGASWALVGPGVSLRQSAVDPAAAAMRLRATGAPGVEAFVRDYVLSQPSDLEALRAFGETLCPGAGAPGLSS